MKKIIFIIITFVLTLSLTCCKSERIVSLEKLKEELSEQYDESSRNVYSAGWYEGNMTTLEYDLDTGERKISSMNAVFLHEKDTKEIRTNVNKAIYSYHTSYYSGFSDNKYEEEYAKFLVNDGKFYRSVEKYENQQITEKYTEGTDNIQNIYCCFDFYGYYNSLSYYIRYLEEHTTHSTFSTVLEYFENSQILTAVDLELFKDITITKTTKYHFNLDYQIEKVEFNLVGYNSFGNICAEQYITLKKCEEINIIVPTEYDKEYTNEKWASDIKIWFKKLFY